MLHDILADWILTRQQAKVCAVAHYYTAYGYRQGAGPWIQDSGFRLSRVEELPTFLAYPARIYA